MNKLLTMHILIYKYVYQCIRSKTDAEPNGQPVNVRVTVTVTP